MYDQGPIQPIGTRKQPWPIRLALRCGVRNESQAVVIVAGVCGVLLMLTIWMYANIFSSAVEEEVAPEIMTEMEEMTDY